MIEDRKCGFHVHGEGCGEPVAYRGAMNKSPETLLMCEAALDGLAALLRDAAIVGFWVEHWPPHLKVVR